MQCEGKEEVRRKMPFYAPRVQPTHLIKWSLRTMEARSKAVLTSDVRMRVLVERRLAHSVGVGGGGTVSPSARPDDARCSRSESLSLSLSLPMLVDRSPTLPTSKRTCIEARSEDLQRVGSYHRCGFSILALIQVRMEKGSTLSATCRYL